MALPYWTDGCMDTIDGVLFESSTTTPFHFLDQAEYSLPGESSNPVAYLNYPSFNLADGIRAPPIRGRAVLPRRVTTSRGGRQVGPGARQDRVDSGLPRRDQPGERSAIQSGTSTSSRARSS